MNLIQIEYFLRVAELGSLTRASLVLGVSQPTLSRQIRALEVQLRHTLLHRNGRGVELTPAGQCLVEHAEAMLEAAARARAALDRVRNAPSGRVVVGLPSRIARVLTEPLLRAFKKQYPKASITVAEGLSTVLHEWLMMGRVEVALLFNPVHRAELELLPLYSEELVLVGPKTAHPAQPQSIALAQLSRYPLILPQMPNATRAVVETAMKHAHMPLNISVEVDTTQNILELIAGRMGYGIMPRTAVRNAGGEARYRVSQITKPSLRNQLYLANLRHRRHTSLAGDLKKLIVGLDVPRLLD